MTGSWVDKAPTVRESDGTGSCRCGACQCVLIDLLISSYGQERRSCRNLLQLLVLQVFHFLAKYCSGYMHCNPGALIACPLLLADELGARRSQWLKPYTHCCSAVLQLVTDNLKSNQGPSLSLLPKVATSPILRGVYIKIDTNSPSHTH